MATEVVMPQMGESIAEGTIVRWIKKVGDPIDQDEPLFEISTDKVDAEIPSPGAGVLLEIKVKEGETVPVNSVVAVIGATGEKAGGTRRRRRTPQRTSRSCGRAAAGLDRTVARGSRARQRRRQPPSSCEPVDRLWPTFAARVVAASCARSRRSTASTSRS